MKVRTTQNMPTTDTRRLRRATVLRTRSFKTRTIFFGRPHINKWQLRNQLQRFLSQRHRRTTHTLISARHNSRHRQGPRRRPILLKPQSGPTTLNRTHTSTRGRPHQNGSRRQLCTVTPTTRRNTNLRRRPQRGARGSSMVGRTRNGTIQL